MITIGFCNLKGGVGKTTACQNIAAALANMGKRIAVIDMDPQSNLSAGFGLTLSPEDPQVFDLLTNRASWDDIVLIKEDIDIIPSSLSLVMAELNQEGPLSDNHVLRDALSKLDSDRYDYIFIDSPPQMGMFTRNVLGACNKIIVPMDGGFYSLVGLRLLDSAMPVLREKINPELEIFGILMTNYNARLSISREVHDEVKKSFGAVLFESWIRPNVSIVEASSMGVSVLKHSPKSKGAECYNEVAAEFLKRMNDTAKPDDSPGKTNHESLHVTRNDSADANDTALPVIGEDSVNYDDVKIESDSEMLKKEFAPVEAPAEVPPEVTRSQPEPVQPETLPELIPDPEPESEPEAQTAQPVTPPALPEPRPTDPYVERIKQDVIDMLPDGEKLTWRNMFDNITDITRGEIDVHELREDFDNSDRDRFTFYVLNDEYNTLWPVMYPDQIIEPLQCVVKWDENGAAEVFM
ncbi:MAG: ParA family protein [Synergistaceae bacterium]|nr:ParA family protein [Synergistaceae bacterium]